jgi:hypothetical protein
MIFAVNLTICGGAADHAVGHREGHLSGNLSPTCVGQKALAIALRELLKAADHVGHASFPRILQRAASKWRESRRKYGAGIQ